MEWVSLKLPTAENMVESLDWTYQQQKGIWAVKINPLNPNTVWAATTEGTYRSYDAGKHGRRYTML